MKKLDFLKDKCKNKFETLTFRERVIFALSVLTVSFVAWDTVLYDYALASESELKNRKKLIQDQIQSLEQQIDSVSGIVGRDTTKELAKQAELLRVEGVSLDNKIVEQSKKMVTPKEMNRVLRSVIQKSEEMTLVNIESLERVALFQENTNLDDKAAINTGTKISSPGKKWQVYNHGLKVEMLGGYFQILSFLKELEKQNLSLVWDEISYEVLEYPKAKIKIIVHTLSLNEGWIGV